MSHMETPRPQEVGEWTPTNRRILVTGGTGLVGSRLVKLASNKDEVISLSRGERRFCFDRSNNLHVIHFDLCNTIGEIKQFLKKFNPTLVVHCAAQANVDEAQQKKEDAWKRNVFSTANLALACKELRIPFGLCSTDCVFPRSGGPFSESDIRQPIMNRDKTVLNFYSWTKICAEQLVEHILEEDKLYFIFRVTFAYDPNYLPKPGTPVTAFLTLARGETWVSIKDMPMMVTPTRWIAYALNRLILKQVWKEEDPIYHIGGPEILTGRDIADICRVELEGRGVKVDKDQVKETTVDEFFQGKAPRQVEGGLRTDKIKEMGIIIPTLAEEIKRFPLP